MSTIKQFLRWLKLKIQIYYKEHQLEEQGYCVKHERLKEENVYVSHNSSRFYCSKCRDEYHDNEEAKFIRKRDERNKRNIEVAKEVKELRELL